MGKIKLILKIIGGLMALVLSLFMGIVVYVNANKTRVFNAIKDQLNENITGTLEIGRMKPTLIRGFPGISILLQDVTLKDSMWHVHRHTLLEAKEIYVSVNALSILTGKVLIRDINIEHAKIHLFTDSTGYSNTRIFYQDAEKDSTKKKAGPRINHLNLTDVEFLLENESKFKLFQFAITKLRANLDYMHGGWNAKIALETHVKNMMFNTSKGSFLKNKLLKTNLDLSYDKTKETLLIPWQLIKLDKEEIQLMGKFVFTETPGTFELYIKADGILYKNAIALLTPSISSKIDMLDLKEKVNVQAVLRGRTKYKDTPEVVVKWQVKNNTFITPGGPIEKCSFSGSFNNQVVPGGGHNDPNSQLEIKDLRGTWARIEFRADTVSITNLKSPVLEGRFLSKFDVTKLNPIIGSTTFHFDKGAVNVNVLYKGGIRNNDTTQPYIFGSMQLTDAAMTYVPRGLTFTNSSATLRFMGSDLFIDEVKIERGTTVLNMKGSLLNFLNLYYTAPEKIILDWDLKSKLVNLNELIPFLAKRQVVVGPPTAPTDTKVLKASSQLDKVLDASSVNIRVQVDRIIYKRFEAEHLNGTITMTSTDIVLKDVAVNHADGKLKMNVHMKQEGSINNYALKTEVEHVNVKKFFTSFDNFGQDAITDKNVAGTLSANIDITGAVKDSGVLVPRSINGTTSFKLENGSLVNFEPIRAIGNLIFRRRNLDSIRFRDIDNKFTIRGDKIIVYPLFIESSALNMHVAGIYAVGSTGTDLKMDIPLRNPGKDEQIFNDEIRHERNMKGIVLHLRAVDGDDGKVKIKLETKNKPAVTTIPVEQPAPQKAKKNNNKSSIGPPLPGK